MSAPLRPDCIIIRLQTVSKGYEVRPATAVTDCAIIQLTKMWVFLGSGSIPLAVSQLFHSIQHNISSFSRQSHSSQIRAGLSLIA